MIFSTSSITTKNNSKILFFINFVTGLLLFCFPTLLISFKYNPLTNNIALSDKESEIGLDTTTICIVENDTITIEWLNGFPKKGYLKKTDGKIVKIKYLSPSFRHETTGPNNISALEIPKIYNNSVDIMIMKGSGTLQMIDIKTGNVVLEEFIPERQANVSLERLPPGQRKKIEESLPYGIRGPHEKPHTVNYDNLPTGAYFMVIFNQDKEVYFIKTIYKDINEKEIKE